MVSMEKRPASSIQLRKVVEAALPGPLALHHRVGVGSGWPHRPGSSPRHSTGPPAGPSAGWRRMFFLKNFIGTSKRIGVPNDITVCGANDALAGNTRPQGGAEGSCPQGPTVFLFQFALNPAQLCLGLSALFGFPRFESAGLRPGIPSAVGWYGGGFPGPQWTAQPPGRCQWSLFSAGSAFCRRRLLVISVTAFWAAVACRACSSPRARTIWLFQRGWC